MNRECALIVTDVRERTPPKVGSLMLSLEGLPEGPSVATGWRPLTPALQSSFYAA
jgi:hypothetical protein